MEQKKKKSGTAEQKGRDDRQQETHGNGGQASSRNRYDSHPRNRSFNDEKKSLSEKLQNDRKRRKSVHSDSEEERSDRERQTSRHHSETGERHKGKMPHTSEGDNDDKSADVPRFKRYGLNVSTDFVVLFYLINLIK